MLRLKKYYFFVIDNSYDVGFTNRFKAIIRY